MHACNSSKAFVLLGVLVDNVFVDIPGIDGQFAIGMSDDIWLSAAEGEPCPEPLGTQTCFNAYTNNGCDGPSGCNPYGDPFAQMPTTDPLPISVATDPYSQLAWFENNIWAYSHQNPEVESFPPSQAQYGRNSIAANIQNSSDTSCTFLFNTQSTEEVQPPVMPDGDASTGIVPVNTAQAIACNYQGNTMTISAAAMGADFAFASGSLSLASNNSQPDWGPGFQFGSLVLGLQNTDVMAQSLQIAPTGCCMTTPTISCSSTAAISYSASQTVLLQPGESQALSLSAQASLYGEGYCNFSVSHIWHDLSVATTAHDFVEQIPFIVDPGGPVTSTVSAQLLFADMEQSWYILPGTVNPNSANGTTFEDLVNG